MARVTLVVNQSGAGSETFLRSLAGILAELGHDLTVHALMAAREPDARQEREPEPGPAAAGGPAVRRSGALPGLRRRGFALAAGRLGVEHPAAVRAATTRAVQHFGPGTRAARAAALAAPVLATEPDVVHLGFSPIAVTMEDALQLLDPGTRVVISCRGSGELVNPVVDPRGRDALGRVLAAADAVHVVSEAVGAAAVELGAVPSRVHLIRPAVDAERFRRRRARTAPGDPLRLVTVGRLVWVKAIDTQIDAVAELVRRGRSVELTVVGEGPERQALTFRADALGVADRVHLVGQRPPEAVRDLVEGADAFVLSSLSEGTSNAVLEAMSLQVPVISTAVGGMPEVIEDGVDGMLVRPGDPGTLADAVERLFGQDGSAGALADAGRHKVLGGYTLDRQRDDVRSMYRSVLA